MVTNYEQEANEHAREAQKILAETRPERQYDDRVQEAQAHATLAVAYATLAVYTATGG